MRLGDTPVLIPNTMVKTQAADGTILETVWESRWLPDFFKKIAEKRLNKYWFYQWLEIKTKFWFLMTDKNSVRFVPWKPNIEIINQLECKAFKVISKFAKRYNKTSEGSCRDVRSNKQNETKPKVTSR